MSARTKPSAEAIERRRQLSQRIAEREALKAEQSKHVTRIARQLDIKFEKIGDGGWMGNGFGNASTTRRASVNDVLIGTWNSKTCYVNGRHVPGSGTLSEWRLAVVQAAVNAIAAGISAR